MSERSKRIFFVVVALLVLHPAISSAIPLCAGLAFALILGNPFQAKTRKLTKPMLATAIVLLGAGTDLSVVARAGLEGAVWTVVALVLTLTVGYGLGRLLKTDGKLSTLLNVGTAICGGSAIAAVAPAIRANDEEISIALIIVFVLNGLALVVFPPLGHVFHLTPEQFGMWAAVAIHDTSSVVGAALAYDPLAVTVATTVKLTRALWILPVTFVFAWIYGRQGQGKAAFPKFILGFLAMSAIVTFIPSLKEPGMTVEFLGRRLLVLTLLFIGAGLSRESLKKLDPRPFAQGVILWILVACLNLAVIWAR